MFNFSVCPDEAIPLTGNGKFSSPNYPIDNYLPSKFCTWTITVSADKRVKFAFTNFALGLCALECSSDTCTYVEVYDGPSESFLCWHVSAMALLRKRRFPVETRCL